MLKQIYWSYSSETKSTLWHDEEQTDQLDRTRFHDQPHVINSQHRLTA